MSLTPAEELLYSTIKIESFTNGSLAGTGTGFFVTFPYKPNADVAVVVTNKHVIASATELAFTCHLADGNEPSGQFRTVRIPIEPGLIYRHPARDVDLCAILFQPIATYAQQTLGAHLFYICTGMGSIPTEAEWHEFDAIEDVIMVGYPRGISDAHNNMPITRRGITASSLSKKYEGRDEFMIDMACFPGSSGSPVFIFDMAKPVFNSKTGSFGMRSRMRLLGALYAGPVIDSHGQIILAKPTTISVKSMMHLGNVIRSTKIIDLRDLLFKANNLDTPTL